MKVILSFLILFISFLSEAKDRTVPSAARRSYDRLSAQFLPLSADPIGVSPIENVALRRDAAIFTLLTGKIYRLPKINDSVHALLFLGKGTVTITPSTEIEKKQLERFYEDGLFPLEIKSLYLLFTDSTYQEISRRCVFSDMPPSSEVLSAVKQSMKVVTYKENDEIDHDLLRPFLFNDSPEMFYSLFASSGDKAYFFEIDPFDEEEVSFGTINSTRIAFSAGGARETILQFHRQHEYSRGPTVVNDPKPEIDITAYTLDNRIASDLQMTTRAQISFTAEHEGRKWIMMSLYHRIVIDSITLPDGRKCDFVRNNESGIFWLYDSGGFSKGKSYTITCHTHGEVIEKDEGWYSLRSSIGWYPRSVTGLDKATFDLRFTFPSRYQLASIGKKISSATEGDNTISEWKLAVPGRNASFIIGVFKEYSVTPDSIPPVTVLVSAAHDAEVRNYLAVRGLMSGKNMDQQVAGDIENSIKFFQHVYGPSSVDQFYAAEIPGNHGEAFPGLVHLSWITFQNTGTDGSQQTFRAHEVAHQWWAAGVDFSTYHDQWISEGFATYSGLWYMQMVIRDNEKFFDQIREYKELILTNRKYLFGSGQEAGPIWLGYRTSSSTTAGDYNLIIYRKGAWVLHMLRNMGLELKTMKEDIFQNLMKDFYQTYKGRSATTDDFRKMTEKHFKIPMDWFFKQWVYNTEVPTYNILYKLEELENGKFKVKCTVKQTNVPDDFQMYVPFLIDFGEKRFARLRYLIKGPVTEFEFPVLPLKPEGIKFNDLESVLCEIDDEDWD